MNMGDCIAALLDTFTLDSTTAGLMAAECAKREAFHYERDGAECERWARRKALWMRVESDLRKAE